METKASRDLRLGGRLWEWDWGEAEVSALNSPDHKLYLILQGKVHLSSWYTETNLDCTWAIKTSPNGWTDNQTALEWIQHFDKYTYDQRVDVYRMIVLDGHEPLLRPVRGVLQGEEHYRPLPPYALFTHHPATRRWLF